MTLAFAIMVAGALGAIALTVAARPSADRFIKW
ncbi:hypothetical protein HNR00_001744 [Methylorubrum rhodinum]|uniref:Uncharacterized protein n=1 Tax=Methylorubrum rhodinum TaxID=29428 RepID=A0A840ZHJ0_9HYPH|nr:hypothetical protein [Methylorubrum rhodinum]